MTIESFKEYFVDHPSMKRLGKYATIFILRRTESECIFRTDREISNECTISGRSRRDNGTDGGSFNRVYMSKRKAIAPERRTGRELLRSFGLLNKGDDDKPCLINEEMCGKCIDCRIYGSAVGNNVSLKSHVVSDEAFSILPHESVTGEHTFNALYETGTMKNEDGKQSQAINTDEVVRPGTIFLDMETISDVTMDEFQYVLANVLRTRRYGAISSRIGKMDNSILCIAFSNCELFSNLEWTQLTYDNICEDMKVAEKTVPAFPIDPEIAKRNAIKAIHGLAVEINGNVILVENGDLQEIINQISEIFSKDENISAFFSKIDYIDQDDPPKEEKKKKKKEMTSDEL